MEKLNVGQPDYVDPETKEGKWTEQEKKDIEKLEQLKKKDKQITFIGIDLGDRFSARLTTGFLLG